MNRSLNWISFHVDHQLCGGSLICYRAIEPAKIKCSRFKIRSRKGSA